jgi:hypothetical protein
MKPILTFVCFFTACHLQAQNLPPVISNVEVALAGNNTLTINYDLFDADGDPVAVSFRATERGGLTFTYNTANATGDLGANVATGTGRQIQWDFSAYASAMPEFRLMLVAGDGQSVDIQMLVDQVDSTRLKNDLTFITGIRHRTAGAAHLQAVKNFIEDAFRDKQLETSLQQWTYQGYQATNIIGRKIGTGTESEVYILGGHFDTVVESPGADDNGSAVAGVLEALRLLAPYSFQKSIRFIGFDLEEAGLVGSVRYVQSGGIPAGETVKGVLNFEMIGYYSESPNSQTIPFGFNTLYPDVYAQLQADQFRGNFINNIGDGNSAALMNAFSTAATTYVPGLKVISLQAPVGWQVLTPDLGRSDHAPFWIAGTPALMLNDGANFRNPHYHKSTDLIGTINFTFMHNVVKAAIATLAELAGIQHASTWWTDTQFFTNTSETAACDPRIYPNPTLDFIQLHWDNCLPENLQLNLIDLTGKTLRQEFIQRWQSGEYRLIDVRNLPSGVYFLKGTSGEYSWVKKVVVD